MIGVALAMFASILLRRMFNSQGQKAECLHVTVAVPTGACRASQEGGGALPAFGTA